MASFEELVASVDPGSDALAGGDDNSEETVVDTEGSGDDEGGAEEPAEGQPALDPASIPPELVPYYKSMQADYTRKTQELADQRRQVEGLDPYAVQAIRNYQQLLQQNPAQAAEYLRQQVGQIEQQYGIGAPPPDPFSNIEPITDTEAALLNVTKQLYQQHQAQQQFIQQQQYAQGKANVDRQFAELEALSGRKIPLEEREQVASECLRTNCRDLTLVWKGLNFEKAAKTGAQNASKVVQKKMAQTGVPQGKVNRAGTNVETAKPKGIEGHFAAAWDKFSGG